ncbi:exodeoxyribonuclease VII small subunit [uncultured Adlercreutzia sp.]|uniref:exodeoxyribonuclease VII small subunit n=1 Tax=uncultured Adlercreutzia sp. TaxID=875803 RepID=UPI002676D383|nr:exodeoxyribonuclease VII small subunit [uncultured Adlercreutzia sp.]
MTEQATEGAAARPVDELTFREALSELESIVAVLESNTLELEESLASYERGVVLLGSLQKRLAGAEQQVEVLMGELVSAPDDAERDTTLS